MSKKLITAGCSFTVNAKDGPAWPTYLKQSLEPYNYHDFINNALSSAGNGLISRKAIYQVTEELKTRPPEDLLVGIIWSGSSRYDYRLSNTEILNFKRDNTHNGWVENPTSIALKGSKHWVVLNHHWADPKWHPEKKSNIEAETYYRYFFDEVGATIYTLEHMLRVQWFLKSKNIKYFCGFFKNEAINSSHFDHPEVSYLFNELDQTTFLPGTSMYNWVEKNSKSDFKLSPQHDHPRTFQHKEYAEQVILPFLKEKYYI